jgi:phosphatidate cytidylyltransferase
MYNRIFVASYLTILGIIGIYYSKLGILIIYLGIIGCIYELYKIDPKLLILSILWIGPSILTTFYYNSTKIIKLIVLVSSFDTLQYISGKTIGKHKCIGISPNKTIEGYIGGYLISLLLCYFIRFDFLKLTILYVYSILGDLFASYIKRQYRLKDFSNALGDHGGFMDRFDSSLFTIPLLLVTSIDI